MHAITTVLAGNGVYARTIARALARSHRLVIVSAAPEDACDVAAQDDFIRTMHAEHRMIILPVPRARWNKVDRSSGWREWIVSAQAQMPLLCAAFADTRSVLCVDWSGMALWAHVRDAIERSNTTSAAASRLPRCVYMNFRVYATSVDLHGPGDKAFYEAAEAASVRASTGDGQHAVALCRTDAIALWCLATTPRAARPGAEAANVDTDMALLGPLLAKSSSDGPQVAVLLPPLRETLASAARSVHPSSGVTVAEAAAWLLPCVVRLSPEKGALTFAQACAQPALREFLVHNSISPVFAGAVGVKEYAESVYSSVEATFGTHACILRTFLSAADLVSIFRRSIANVHPTPYDAYGMTLVEAAACGAPCLVQAVSGLPAAAEEGSSVVRFVPLAKDLAGAQVMHVLGAAARPYEATREMLQRIHLPTVGACDLLGDPVSADDASSATATLSIDWSSTAAEIAATIQRHLERLLAVPPDRAAISARAIAWDEPAFALALDMLL